MKLAEALTKRADIQKHIEQLGDRLQNNARVQEGEKPAEDPQDLLKQLDQDYKQLEQLMCRINETNATCGDGKHTLTQMLARRECMTNRLSVMRNFLDAASATADRATKSEIKIVSTVNVAAMQKKVDADAKVLRQLDVDIQSLNWTTELK
mgnify:CR=1 FL=1